MPATNFHEYARGIEDVLDVTAAAGEVVTLQNGVVEDRLVQLVLTKAVNLL